jgi:hypothetical protein
MLILGIRAKALIEVHILDTRNPRRLILLRKLDELVLLLVEAVDVEKLLWLDKEPEGLANFAIVALVMSAVHAMWNQLESFEACICLPHLTVDAELETGGSIQHEEKAQLS